MIKKYRKKPVVIEAVQLLWENWNDVCELIGLDNMGQDKTYGIIEVDPEGYSPIGLEIKTLEGTMKANEGDFIIKGIKGEVYPCKADIFENTYEEVRGVNE